MEGTNKICNTYNVNKLYINIYIYIYIYPDIGPSPQGAKGPGGPKDPGPRIKPGVARAIVSKLKPFHNSAILS